jgi:hypothetical protein
MPALGKLLSVMRTPHALFRLLTKPFRSRDPLKEAHDAGAELEMDEARARRAARRSAPGFDSMKAALAFAVLAAILASGCGSDDSASQPTTTSDGMATLSSEDVEKAFRADAASGGVVSHDDTPPKSVDCVKGEGDQVWRCEVSPAGGGDAGRVCIITVDPATRTVTERTCGRIDN